MIKVGDKYLRNLEEQVQYLTNYHDVNQGLVQWGIRVVGQVTSESELPDPATYDGEYGDAIAVGAQAPFSFFIWTRASIEGGADYWFPFGQISIVGPQGPVGPQGEKGDTGASTQWYSYNNLPNNPVEGDMALDDNGGIYRYQNGAWESVTNIKGPQGIQGPTGPIGPQGPQGEKGEKGDRGDVGGFINIWGIVGNTSQLPTPASLDNLTVAYLVGSQNPYDLWVQVGANSEVAVWTNTGPFNVGTLISVNGNYQNVWDADTKLDKVTKAAANAKVYGVNASGKQWMINLYNNPDQTSGVGIPRTDYVDNYFVRKPSTTQSRDVLFGMNDLGEPYAYKIYSEEFSENLSAIPIYAYAHTVGTKAVNFSIPVGDPQHSYAAANKLYVDNTIKRIFSLSGTTLTISTDNIN